MTRDISTDYDRWAGGGHAAAFSPDSPFGGDHVAVRSGRIDPGRLELHQAVERQLAQSGGGDYGDSAAGGERGGYGGGSGGRPSGGGGATRPQRGGWDAPKGDLDDDIPF